MIRFETRSFYSELQRQLNADATHHLSTMEVVAGEDLLQVTREDHETAPQGLSFGPYGASPLSGLHFDSPEDSVAS